MNFLKVKKWLKIMTKIFVDKEQFLSDKKVSIEDIKHYLAKNNHCYVLLTCSDPSEKGDMQVEMVFEGDEDLACLMLEGGMDIIRNKNLVSKDK